MSVGKQRVLIVGATGFVGRHLYPALVEAGYEVVCGSRDPARAAARFPDRRWVRVDLDQPASLQEGLTGVNHVVYLVHHLASGPGYHEREVQAARDFVRVAQEHGIDRVVYLGGVAPTGRASRHLKGRLDTGEALRDSQLHVIELRASMIVGGGSDSWNIVADLSARLPAMLLPKWLLNESRPIAIDDVVAAITFALSSSELRPAWYDIPGPDQLTHAELLRIAAGLSGKRPIMVGVPVLSPFLSSYWIAAVTRTPLVVAKEIVQGLQADLVGTENTLWVHVKDYEPMPIAQAMRQAMLDEGKESPSEAARERLQNVGRRIAGGGAS